jgi:hypothetical protein
MAEQKMSRCWWRDLSKFRCYAFQMSDNRLSHVCRGTSANVQQSERCLLHCLSSCVPDLKLSMTRPCISFRYYITALVFVAQRTIRTKFCEPFSQSYAKESNSNPITWRGRRKISCIWLHITQRMELILDELCHWSEHIRSLFWYSPLH